MTPQRLFCFGIGYTGERLVRHLLKAGWQVAGTSRESEKLQRLRELGVEVFRFERGHPSPALKAALADTTHLLSAVPPDSQGDPVVATLGAALVASSSLQWLGYLSTTGVYGDRGGDWVDENSALRPNSARSRQRVEAENAWQQVGRSGGRPVQIFRLAGIYGPGRSALDSVRAGRAHRIIKPGQRFSRIHVEDLVAVLEASMARPATDERIFNVCDDEAAPPQDVVAYACALLGVAPPPEVPYDEAALTPMARSFFADNKRVRNDRMKRELGVVLRYPTYREGLRALSVSPP